MCKANSAFKGKKEKRKKEKEKENNHVVQGLHVRPIYHCMTSYIYMPSF
jgi:hypothetical protein